MVFGVNNILYYILNNIMQTPDAFIITDTDYSIK